VAITNPPPTCDSGGNVTVYPHVTNEGLLAGHAGAPKAGHAQHLRTLGRKFGRQGHALVARSGRARRRIRHPATRALNEEEDFAETSALYAMVLDTPVREESARAWMPARFAALDSFWPRHRSCR